MAQYRDIRLPEALCSAVEQRYARRFANIQELLEFVLSQLADQRAAELDAAEQQLIEKRLHDLGYM